MSGTKQGIQKDTPEVRSLVYTLPQEIYQVFISSTPLLFSFALAAHLIQFGSTPRATCEPAQFAVAGRTLSSARHVPPAYDLPFRWKHSMHTRCISSCISCGAKSRGSHFVPSCGCSFTQWPLSFLEWRRNKIITPGKATCHAGAALFAWLRQHNEALTLSSASSSQLRADVFEARRWL